MHINTLPNYFLFVDRYNREDYDNDSTNLAIIYRNYSIYQNKKEVLKIKHHCKKKGYKFYISNNHRLAFEFKADGIYIPAFNKNFGLKKFSLEKKFKVIGSAHNQIEINQKIRQGCSLIFLSPVFKNKKNNKQLGTSRFNLLTLNNKIKFIALGGINEKNIKILKVLNICGIAGISYFKKKPAQKNWAGFKNQFNDRSLL